MVDSCCRCLDGVLVVVWSGICFGYSVIVFSVIFLVRYFRYKSGFGILC